MKIKKCLVCGSKKITVWQPVGAKSIGSIDCSKCGSVVPYKTALSILEKDNGSFTRY
jgi:transcription elongation factor Elf1